MKHLRKAITILLKILIWFVIEGCLIYVLPESASPMLRASVVIIPTVLVIVFPLKKRITQAIPVIDEEKFKAYSNSEKAALLLGLCKSNANIVNSTTDIDEFAKRWHALLQDTRSLIELEYRGVNFSSSPRADLKSLSTNLPKSIEHFFERYFRKGRFWANYSSVNNTSSPDLITAIKENDAFTSLMNDDNWTQLEQYEQQIEKEEQLRAQQIERQHKAQAQAAENRKKQQLLSSIGSKRDVDFSGFTENEVIVALEKQFETLYNRSFSNGGSKESIIRSYNVFKSNLNSLTIPLAAEYRLEGLINEYDKRFNDLESVSSVDGMDGIQFENWCAALLEKNLFKSVVVTPGSGDQGVDITAVKGGIKYAIQCKCYSHDLGNTPIQEINAGKQYYGCQVGVVMTNRYFTRGAKALAETTGVLLWDRDMLQQMLNKTADL